jgi:predicted DCC family thiol-disulfide oxidoreductase YuxK
VKPATHGDRPVLVFDGECGFCRHWIARWRRLTGTRIEYAAYQQAAGRYPHIPLERFEKAVQLIEPDGSVSAGAEAIVRTVREVRGLGWLLGAYRHVPGVAWASERAYRFVADHRPMFSRLTRWLFGTAPEPPSRPT